MFKFYFVEVDVVSHDVASVAHNAVIVEISV